ncbi:Dabb family protein [Microbacterium sp. MPKO10]|uniref:Dabb family protein n=1 Tax=Microbacterium sp. MPKO10 TaxID=2989818 RepID=UPI0022364163|nr:Dabb family protein [Microbacterium sp. MPKO10]MCW4456960.1 Dabb family protein [Microbacterium sp. MPKO10]
MAIKHIVMWTLAGDDEAAKEDAAAQIATRLEGLIGRVAGIQSLEVKRNAAFDDVNYDLALVSVHDDVSALKAYQVHPEHAEIAAYIRSVVAQRASIDIEL